MKAISSALGTGKTKQVPKEDALLHKEISVSFMQNNPIFYLIPDFCNSNVITIIIL